MGTEQPNDVERTLDEAADLRRIVAKARALRVADERDEPYRGVGALFNADLATVDPTYAPRQDWVVISPRWIELVSRAPHAGDMATIVLNPDVLDNTETWTTEDGREIKLADLTPEHRAGIRRLLERKAGRYKTIRLLRLGIVGPGEDAGELAQDAYRMYLSRLEATPALDIMRATPLYKALAELDGVGERDAQPAQA